MICLYTADIYNFIHNCSLMLDCVHYGDQQNCADKINTIQTKGIID